MKPIELVSRDAIRLVDAYLSKGLWERQANGEKIFKSEYVPIERIARYEARMVRYGGYVARHVKDGTPLEDVIKFIEKAFSYLPDSVKKAINDFISELIKKLLKEIF